MLCANPVSRKIYDLIDHKNANVAGALLQIMHLPTRPGLFLLLTGVRHVKTGPPLPSMSHHPYLQDSLGLHPSDKYFTRSCFESFEVGGAADALHLTVLPRTLLPVCVHECNLLDSTTPLCTRYDFINDVDAGIPQCTSKRAFDYGCSHKNEIDVTTVKYQERWTLLP